MTRKVKEKVLKRDVCGISIVAGGGRNGMPSAHLIYEEQIDDGVRIFSRIKRGYSLAVVPQSQHVSTNAKNKWVFADFRPDLLETISAAAILLQPIINACLEMDSLREKLSKKSKESCKDEKK